MEFRRVLFRSHELWSGRLIVPASGSALAIAYVAIFPSFLAYLFFNRGVELIGSAATGQYMNVMPLIGAGLAMLFLGEALYLFHVAGLALIVAGILVAGRPPRSEEHTSELQSLMRISYAVFCLKQKKH